MFKLTTWGDLIEGFAARVEEIGEEGGLDLKRYGQTESLAVEAVIHAAIFEVSRGYGRLRPRWADEVAELLALRPGALPLRIGEPLVRLRLMTEREPFNRFRAEPIDFEATQGGGETREEAVRIARARTLEHLGRRLKDGGLSPVLLARVDRLLPVELDETGEDES